MSLSPLNHKLLIVVTVLGLVLSAYADIIPEGFWEKFATATHTLLTTLAILIKTGQEPPKKASP